MVTADDLKQTTMQMIMFADGSNPKHVQVCQCLEYPALTRIWAAFKDGRKTMIYFIDHEPVPLKGVEDRHVVLAERLNDALAKKPELSRMTADPMRMIEEARRIVGV